MVEKQHFVQIVEQVLGWVESLGVVEDWRDTVFDLYKNEVDIKSNYHLYYLILN